MVRGARFLALVTLALAIPACGGKHKGLLPAPVPGTVLVTPTSGLITVETPAGATAQFTVVLGKAPTADVTIAVSSSNAFEGTPSTNSLLFTSTNWDTAQTVTVTGVDDFVVDGDQAYTIDLGAVVSADATYTGIVPANVSVTNTDDDVAGFTFSATSGLVTTESGGTATFNVVLKSQPTADVTFDLSSDNVLAGTLSAVPLTLTFTDGLTPADPNAWNVPHTVTITGVDDVPAAINVPVVYHIVATTSTSTDLNYSGKTVLAAPGVTVTNNDNDSAGITATPTSGLLTSESGGTATFTVVLNTLPTADVVIAVTSQNTSMGLVSTGAGLPGTTLNLTFTTVDWNTAQTVTLTGVDDPQPKVNAAVAYTVILHPTSADAAYDTANLADVNIDASNASDDVAGIAISKLSGLITNEIGTQDTFTVQLFTVPTGPVTLTLTSSDTAEGTVSPATLAFTTTNWNTAQTVTLTGVNDFAIDGSKAYKVTVAVDPTSADTDYLGVAAIDVLATNDDNDAVGFNVSKTSSVSTSESGTIDTFTVALTSAPVSPVTVTLSVTVNPGEVSVTSTLTFAADNSALTPQTVTVTGLPDGVVDGNKDFTISGSATAGDAAYTALPAFTVTGTNTDIDITVPPGAGGWAANRVPTPTLPAATVGAWDEKSQQEPSVVLKVGPTYMMWYEGANAGGQKHEQIGLATSNDGIVWIKDATNPVLSHSGINGTFDKNGAGDPSVVFDGTTYRMWYAGRENAATKNKIGLATSGNGISWTKNSSTPVLIGTAGTFDSVGVSSPHVVLVGTTYHMWYTGLDASGVTRIGHATSPSTDGVNWIKTAGAVLGTGTAGSFDAAGARACAVILDGAKYRMWYIGLDVTGPAGRQRLGYADSDDGIVWTKFVANPVLSAGAPGAFDEKNILTPYVILDAGTFKMWYAGENNAGAIRIGYIFTP